MKKRAVIIIAIFSFLVCVLSDLQAQVSLNAPPEDAVYQAIDIFIANDLVGDVVMGQRPFSRMEVARILKVVRAKFDGWQDELEKDQSSFRKFNKLFSRKRFIKDLLVHYEKEYGRELDGVGSNVDAEPIKKVEFTLLKNTSEPRSVPVNNGQGNIDAFVTSFDKYQQGITYPKSAAYFINSEHNLYATDYFVATAQPRFEFYGDEGKAYVHRLYAKTGWRNIELEIGRDNIYWGQSEFGGTMLSTNPRPLDMVKLSNPRPFRLPWVLKYIGDMRLTFFLSNLGPQYNYPYSYFYGLKWSTRPCKYFELGLSETVIMGGDGAPKLSFWDPLKELFPFHKWGRNAGTTDLSNHAFGLLDMRVNLPWLGRPSLYFDSYFDDSFWRALGVPDNLMNQMAFITGIYMPRLSFRGDWGARFEYHHTSPLSYRHGNWVSGYALDRRVMGDALGPTADGYVGTLYWMPAPTYRGRLEFSYEDYDSSTYYTDDGANGEGPRVHKLASGPHEYRYRTIVEIEWKGEKRVGFKLRGGYERIRNFNFIEGDSVNNMLVSGTLSLYFDDLNF